MLHTIDAGGRSIGEIARNVWREERSQKTPEASNLALTATEIDVNGHKNDPYFFRFDCAKYLTCFTGCILQQVTTSIT